MHLVQPPEIEGNNTIVGGHCYRAWTGILCGDRLHPGVAEPASLLVNSRGSLGCYKDTTQGILRHTKREGANSQVGTQVGIVGDTQPEFLYFDLF